MADLKDEFVTMASERIEQRILDNHTFFLTGEIEEGNIKEAVKWILYENMEPPSPLNRNKRLSLYINSLGGDVYEAFALIDMMRRSKYPVATLGIGQIMSAGFLIFISGAKNYRFIAPNTGIMCHQFSTGLEGKYHDIKAVAKENELINERMMNILREASGLESRTIKSKLLSPTDAWLTAEELIEYKMADHILK